MSEEHGVYRDITGRVEKINEELRERIEEAAEEIREMNEKYSDYEEIKKERDEAVAALSGRTVACGNCRLVTKERDALLIDYGVLDQKRLALEKALRDAMIDLHCASDWSDVGSAVRKLVAALTTEKP